MLRRRLDLPNPIERSDKHAQEIFEESHDAALETYEGDEARAHRVAYAALKHQYKKDGDRWVRKARKGPSDPQAARGPTTSPSSTDPPTKTGGGRVVGEEQSRAALYEQARKLGISGRSRMNKEELAVALNERRPR